MSVWGISSLRVIEQASSLKRHRLKRVMILLSNFFYLSCFYFNKYKCFRYNKTNEHCRWLWKYNTSQGIMISFSQIKGKKKKDISLVRVVIAWIRPQLKPKTQLLNTSLKKVFCEQFSLAYKISFIGFSKDSVNAIGLYP